MRRAVRIQEQDVGINFGHCARIVDAATAEVLAETRIYPYGFRASMLEACTKIITLKGWALEKRII